METKDTNPLFSLDIKSQEKLTEYWKIEAEWVSNDMKNFVNLIQRYRALYVTAIFLSLGWLLGQTLGIVGSSIPDQAGSNPGNIPITMDSIRLRPEVAMVLCAVILVNLVFGLLMFEALAQLRSLARYRFILGYELGEYILGGNNPIWRWECWKDRRPGSFRGWTITLNLFFFVLAVSFTVGSLWFIWPAVQNSPSTILRGVWWFTSVVSFGVIMATAIMGYRYRGDSGISNEPTLRWTDLKLKKSKDCRNAEAKNGEQSHREELKSEADIT